MLLWIYTVKDSIPIPESNTVNAHASEIYFSLLNKDNQRKIIQTEKKIVCTPLIN